MRREEKIRKSAYRSRKTNSQELQKEKAETQEERKLPKN